MVKGKIIGIELKVIYLIEEKDIYEFLESNRWEGTAYEKGTDDKTKINKLLDEVSEFRQRIKELEKEKRELEE